MTGVTSLRRVRSAVLAALLVAVGLYGFTEYADAASSLPADKMTVVAGKSTVTSPDQTVTLLVGKIKTSNPADLLLQVSAQCTILTSITNSGLQDSQSYQSKVEVWVEVDGRPVPVVPAATTTGANSGTGGTDDGDVIFCNREFARTTTFSSGNESISDVENTAASHAFNWVALNVGSGVHDIVVKGRFTNTSTTKATAQAVIAQRTLVVEPTNYFISQPNA